MGEKTVEKRKTEMIRITTDESRVGATMIVVQSKQSNYVMM